MYDTYHFIKGFSFRIPRGGLVGVKEEFHKQKLKSFVMVTVLVLKMKKLTMKEG
jgi:hypothetical protein